MESKYLSDIEQDKVTAFLNDKILVEAVKKVLFKPIYTHGVLKENEALNPLENFALNVYKTNTDGYNEQYSDEELGKLTKIRRLAIELVVTAFNDLEKMKKVPAVDNKLVNKAR